MAVKASAQITITYVVDVKAYYRYYLLQSSTLSTPSKPTTYPPASTWDDTEPSYVDGSTNTLYFVDCTVFNDNTFKYSEVSKSSSYEAAKSAYNKAVNAQNSIDNLEIGARNLYIVNESVDGYLHSDGSGNILPAGTLTKEKTSNFIPVNAGDELVYQLWVTTPADSYVWWGYQFFKEDQTPFDTSRPATHHQDMTNGFYHLIWPNVIVVPEGAAYIRVTARMHEDGRIKVEKGNKPTDWTPAPEDIDGKIDIAQNTIDNTQAYTHTVLSLDGGTTLTYFDFSGHMESGTLSNGADSASTSYVRSYEYAKVNGGSSYVWNIEDVDGTVKTPTTHFYTYDSTNETYTYLNSQSTATITVPAGTDVYLRFAVAITLENMTNSILELTLSNLDSIVESQTVNVYIGINTTLTSYMSINATDYEWELTDTSTLKNATELAEKLNKQLYDETNGDIKLIYDGISGVQSDIDVVEDDIDLYKSYVQIDPDAPSISLVTSGDINNPGNKVAITDKKISFYNGATEGASIGYIDDEQDDRTGMAASKTYITEMYPRVEDPNAGENEQKWIGSLCWIARTNGHLSLKVVK